MLIVAATLVALIPVALLDRLGAADALPADLARVLPFALGVAFLGLADDMLSGLERGWRGHGAPRGAPPPRIAFSSPSRPV